MYLAILNNSVLVILKSIGFNSNFLFSNDNLSNGEALLFFLASIFTLSSGISLKFVVFVNSELNCVRSSLTDRSKKATLIPWDLANSIKLSSLGSSPKTISFERLPKVCSFFSISVLSKSIPPSDSDLTNNCWSMFTGS